MAQYDSADLLLRFRDDLGRPSTDEAMPDDRAYRFLSRAQEDVARMLAAVCPDANATRTVLTTPDGGVSYVMPVDAQGNPQAILGHAELYASPTSDEPIPLVPFHFGSTEGAMIQGNAIVWPGGRSRTFGADGPVLRYVPMPVPMSAAVQPSLMPVVVRPLIVDRALILAARRLKVDPTRFIEQFKEDWIGDPSTGDWGILGLLRTRFANVQPEAVSPRWWAGLDTGSGYTRHD